MPFFAKRDTVMPAHLKEGGDYFSDTGTLHPSQDSSKKTSECFPRCGLRMTAGPLCSQPQ